jgi:hypothetical protein
MPEVFQPDPTPGHSAPLERAAPSPYREPMTQPGADPLSDKSHEHIDLGALMDGSERGPDTTDEHAAGAHSTAIEYGEAADLSGETSDGYVTGQDEGSID